MKMIQPWRHNPRRIYKPGELIHRNPAAGRPEDASNITDANFFALLVPGVLPDGLPNGGFNISNDTGSLASRQWDASGVGFVAYFASFGEGFFNLRFAAAADGGSAQTYQIPGVDAFRVTIDEIGESPKLDWSAVNLRYQASWPGISDALKALAGKPLLMRFSPLASATEPEPAPAATPRAKPKRKRRAKKK